MLLLVNIRHFFLENKANCDTKMVRSETGCNTKEDSIFHFLWVL